MEFPEVCAFRPAQQSVRGFHPGGYEPRGLLSALSREVSVSDFWAMAQTCMFRGAHCRTLHHLSGRISTTPELA